METPVHVIRTRPFWKHRTHLPVRPYIAIILPRSWRLRASFPRAFRRILSLHSVDRVQPFFALPDVGTYRLGASVARTPPTAKSKYNRPDTHVFSISRVLGHLPVWKAPFTSKTSARFGNIGRTCRYVPASQSFSSVYGVCVHQPHVVSYPCILLTARSRFPRCGM